MNTKALKKDNAFTFNRTEKFRYGERKKGRVEDITLSADLANGSEREQVAKYGFATRYTLQRMMVRWLIKNTVQKSVVFFPKHNGFIF